MAYRVLIVDDDDAGRGALADLLRGEGFDVEEAPDGMVAAVRLPPLRPDVLLLDLMMPRFDGMALLSHVRTFYRRIPVIMITAVRDPDVANEARRMGAFSVLEKPVHLDDVLRALRRAVAN